MAPLLFFVFLLSEAASEPVVVQVGPEQLGQNVTLPCDTDDTSIRVAKWIRSDMSPPTEILFWRGGKTYSDFEDRVQLVDGELKTGDVSLTLKNMSRDDVGTYECRVVTAGSRLKKRAVTDTKLISIVQLQLADPENNGGGNKDGHNGDKEDPNNIDTHHHVGLGAAAVGVFLLVPAAVGLFLVSKSKRPREKKPEPSAAEETGDNLL